MNPANIIMPENVSNIWMIEPELVEHLGVIDQTIRCAIRNIYNIGPLKEYEVQKYVRQENGYHAEVYQMSDDSRTRFPQGQFRCGTDEQCHTEKSVRVKRESSCILLDGYKWLGYVQLSCRSFKYRKP